MKTLETTGENWRDEHGRLTEGHPPIGGRPKGSISITAEIKKQLLEVPIGEQQTNLSKLVAIIFEKALIQKDQQCIKLIWSYVDGLPRSKVDLDVDRTNLAELTMFFRQMANPRESMVSGPCVEV